MSWPASSREQALAAWRRFLPQITRYAAQRNFVDEGLRGVSRLSPALRLGLLRPEELVRDSLAQHPLQRVEKWVQEVCWRSYWKGWLEMRPQVWRQWRREVRQLKAELPAEVLERARLVSEGQSGVAIMDHFALELRQSGYLHNHARMWWASFWVHAQRLPWALGAEFFFQHLLDADPASNTLSWRWVAGLQTPGKTYLVRRSNLERFCDPQLLTRHGRGLAQLDDGQVQPWIAPESADLSRRELPDLPQSPAQLEGRIGLWLHADDLCLEDGVLAGLKPHSIAAFCSEAVEQDMGLSPQRIASIKAALQDGLARASAHFPCAGHLHEAGDLAAAMAHWASRERLSTVLCMMPNVGPIADALPRIRQQLDGLGVALHALRRPWDAKLFGHARAGFFPFWEKTSRWLAANHPPQQLQLL